MPGASVNLGTGATIAFATSGFSMEFTDINIDGLSREAIDVSHLGTSAGTSGVGSKPFIGGKLSDPGEISMEGHFDPDKTPPLQGATEAITITFPLVAGDSTSATWAGNGFLTGFSQTTPLEDKMGASLTVKMSGEWTITVAT